MPCALTSGEDYPDYLKKILKEIDEGDDEDLKECACKLKSPVTDEGCYILDEDNKVGAFPFCVPTGTITSGSFIAVSLKEAMSIFWKVKIMSFVWLSKQPFILQKQEGKIQRSLSYDKLIPVTNRKNLVCPLPYWGYDVVETVINELFPPTTTTVDSEPNFILDGVGDGSDGFTGVVFDWNSMVQSNEIFYIRIVIYIGLGDNQPQTYTLDSPPYDGEPDEEKSSVIWIFGKPVEARYWTNGSFYPEDRFNPIQLIIEPLEYWP